MRAVLIVVALAACGEDDLLGTTCATDDDCGDLECESITVEQDGSCFQVARVCTRACTSDVECQVLDRNWSCRPGCLGRACFGP